MKIVKDLIVCAKLVKYGKQAKVTRVCGVVCVVLGLVSLVGVLACGGTESALFSSYIMSMGIMFMFQPLLSLCYCGSIAATPIRIAAERLWSTLMVAVMVMVVTVVSFITGSIVSAFVPTAAAGAGLSMTAMLFIGLIVAMVAPLSKLGVKAYVLFFFLCIIAPNEVMQNVLFDYTLFPLGGTLWANTLIVTGAGAAITLLTYLLCLAVYKKPYGEAFKKMNAMEI